MNEEIKNELKIIIEQHIDSIFNNHKGSIIVLLKEFARRMLIWTKTTEESGHINADRIFCDVAHLIVGEKAHFFEIKDLSIDDSKLNASHLDNLIFSYWVNFKIHEPQIRELGYSLTNPYAPYIEVFKRGGGWLDYRYSRLEICSYFGILIHPMRDFMTDIPFYMTEKDLTNADKEWVLNKKH